MSDGGPLTDFITGFCGFLAPGAVIIGAAVAIDSQGGSAITAGEWVVATVSVIVAAAGLEVGVTRRAATAARRAVTSATAEVDPRSEPTRGDPHLPGPPASS